MDIIFKILRYLKKHETTIKNIIMAMLVVGIVAVSIVANNYKSLYDEQKKITNTLLEDKSNLVSENEELNLKVQDCETQIAKQENLISDLEEDVEEAKKEVEAAKASTKVATTKSVEPTVVPDGNYDQATKVWKYLKSLGLNDFVCAGILGNIMAEVGGQTLDISRWPTYSKKNYYGICQWSGGRKSRLLNDFGNTLEAQLKFLGTELFEVIPKTSSFYKMQNEKEAALYFAKYYERCSSKYYSIRQTNATKALTYFTVN